MRVGERERDGESKRASKRTRADVSGLSPLMWLSPVGLPLHHFLSVYLIAAILTRLSPYRDDAPTVNSGEKIRLASVRMPLQQHYIHRSKVSLCAAIMIMMLYTLTIMTGVLN